jgi:sensor histidine kinase regulating citrate/malate metabolism
MSYNFAATVMKQQLVMKCQALAATVSAVIEEDSDGYTAFLKEMDMETDYYRYTKALMMNLKNVNAEHVTYIYTEARVDADTMMYVIGGDDPASPTHTAPGVRDAITTSGRIAYDSQSAVLGEDFIRTEYGVRISAYQPIIHKETGKFLGLVGADITQSQYNEIMRIFILQTAVSLIVGLTVIVLSMMWLSGSIKRAIKEEARTLSLQKRLAAVITEAVYGDEFKINNLVSDLLQKAGEYGITANVNLKAAPVRIANADLYSLLSNMLENAMEACAVMPKGRERFIHLTIIRREPYISICCKNSKSGEIVSEDGVIQTSKSENGHGYGLLTVGRIVDTYDGIMDVDYDENTFTITVALKDPSQG